MPDKLSDLRNLTKDELGLKLTGLKTELFNLRFQAESGRVEKPHRIKQIRKEIARIKTIINEGERKNAVSSKQA
jgi:large subunit ribosomal protein L29